LRSLVESCQRFEPVNYLHLQDRIAILKSNYDSYETLVELFYQTTREHVPEDGKLRYENLHAVDMGTQAVKKNDK
jgi:hypothetical protein